MLRNVAFLILLQPAALLAAAPSVSQFFPAGAEVGQTIEVAAIGKFSWPLKAWSSSPHVAVVPQEAPGLLEVRVASAAAPGIVWVRLYNDEGVSAMRAFVVGTLPEMQEKEPNGSLTEAQEVGDPITINARLRAAGDVDTYSVELQEGETLVASLEAHQHLDSPMDGLLQIVGIRGNVIAQNDDYNETDPQIVFRAPQSAKYFVRAFGFPAKPNSTIGFAGGDLYVYRLTLTRGGFVDHLYPLAIPRNLGGSVEVRGWNIPDEFRELTLLPPADSKSLVVRHSSLANTFPVRLVEQPVAVEIEPNGVGNPVSITVPVTLNGIINPARDRDVYLFKAAKDQSFRFDVDARMIGSPISCLLRVIDSSGKEVAKAVEFRGKADPDLNFKAPAEGEYTLEVRDAFDHGGSRYVYSVHATSPPPEYRLTLPGAGQNFTLTPGKELEIPVEVERQFGFDREIEVAIVGLPASVVAPPVRSAPKGDTAGKVALKLTSKEGPFAGTIQIVGKEVGPAAELQMATFSTQGWNEPSSMVWLTVLAPPKPEEKKEAEKK